MISVSEIKQYITPKELAVQCLGQPIKRAGDNYWYKSPFRQERTASFVVSSKGFHDFGTSRHYDIVDFIKELYNCPFNRAKEILCNMCGLKDNDNKELRNWLRQQQIKNERYVKRVERFYLCLWDEIEKEEKTNNGCLDIFIGDLEDDTYKICLDRKVYIEGLTEYLVNANFKCKESLFNQFKRGEFPTWLMMRLKNNIIVSMISSIEQNPKKEF